jgi:hypothetical protein
MAAIRVMFSLLTQEGIPEVGRVRSGSLSVFGGNPQPERRRSNRCGNHFR